MWGKPKEVKIEISDESRQALSALDDDVHVLSDLVQELLATHQKMLEIVRGEIAVLVADATGVDGVQVTPDEPKLGPVAEARLEAAKEPVDESAKRGRVRPKTPLAMQENADWDNSGDPNKIRNSPFTRAPRHVQVEWLKEVLDDNEWYAAALIAREYAQDERHHRYLKHAVSGRLREMHEEGMVERRDSHVRGSMYEYRLPRRSGNE